MARRGQKYPSGSRPLPCGTLTLVVFLTLQVPTLPSAHPSGQLLQVPPASEPQHSSSQLLPRPKAAPGDLPPARHRAQAELRGRCADSRLTQCENPSCRPVLGGWSCCHQTPPSAPTAPKAPPLPIHTFKCPLDAEGPPTARRASPLNPEASWAAFRRDDVLLPTPLVPRPPLRRTRCPQPPSRSLHTTLILWEGPISSTFQTGSSNHCYHPTRPSRPTTLAPQGPRRGPRPPVLLGPIGAACAAHLV